MGDGRVALIADVTGIVEHARLSFDSVVESSSSKASTRESRHRRIACCCSSTGLTSNSRCPFCKSDASKWLVATGSSVSANTNTSRWTVCRCGFCARQGDQCLRAGGGLGGVGFPDVADSAEVRDQAMAILVSRIVDTESLLVHLQEHPEQDQGILGSAVVRGRLTLFLDIHRLSQKMYGKPLPAPAGAASTQRPRRLLLIDDTPFFRESSNATSWRKATRSRPPSMERTPLEQLAKGRDFDLIVSDIEMPLMDGWEFAARARRRGVKTPMLALTSLSGIPYEVKAKDCGYDSYEVKLDHDRLVRKVGNLLAAQASLNVEGRMERTDCSARFAWTVVSSASTSSTSRRSRRRPLTHALRMLPTRSWAW